MTKEIWTQIEPLVASLLSWLPAAITFSVGIVIIGLIDFLLLKRSRTRETHSRMIRHLSLIALTCIVIVVTLLISPIEQQQKSQLLNFLGILLSAVIALSSTTFVGNSLAGFMLKAVRNFRPGDFLRVGDHFGCVTEQGLFHTEIQTEDRDLTTLPNLYLATHPVTVVRESGTMISTTLSLGYDNSVETIEKALRDAAAEIGLTDSFVHIMSLNDYSVTYKIAGMLSDTSTLVSTRSRLKRTVMKMLHQNGVEIVSPTFMNQRVYPVARKFIPFQPTKEEETAPEDEGAAEKAMFDKAEEAKSREMWVDRLDFLKNHVKELRANRKETEEEHRKKRIDMEIELFNKELERVEGVLKNWKTNEA